MSSHACATPGIRRMVNPAELHRKRSLLLTFEQAEPGDAAYWQGWQLAENLARRRGMPYPPTKTHAAQMIRDNILWLESQLNTNPSNSI